MLNYWWVTRPKRKLDNVPEILRCLAEVSQDNEWRKNVYTHLVFESALEQKGLKRPGERKDQRGGGGRTYFVWLSSLGLIYISDATGQVHLTQVGQLVLSSQHPEEVLSDQVLKYQFPSPFSLSPASAKTRVAQRFQIRPFRFLLKLLCDPRLDNKLSKEEIGRIVATEADNENDDTFERVISRVLQYREEGIAALSDDFFALYAPSTGKVNISHPYSHLDDLANTMINWLEYTKLVYRTSGHISILPEKLPTIEDILNDGSELIECANCQEKFQQLYGLVSLNWRIQPNLQ